jgi:hypothetical protein
MGDTPVTAVWQAFSGKENSLAKWASLRVKSACSKYSKLGMWSVWQHSSGKMLHWGNRLATMCSMVVKVVQPVKTVTIKLCSWCEMKRSNILPFYADLSYNDALLLCCRVSCILAQSEAY